MNLKPILDNNSPHAHTKLELDMFGVAEACERYGLPMERIKMKKTIFLPTCYPNNNRPLLGHTKFQRLIHI
jgi:hypothetical protein